MDFRDWLQDELNKREWRAALLDEQLQADNARRAAADQEQAFQTLMQILETAEWWVEHGDPRDVKYIVGKLVTLTVYPDKTVKADRRERN